MYKIGMISLGCPKNQVDAELMLAKLEQEGFEIVNETWKADAVIINTCGFIEDAKKEAIENILEMAQLKEEGEIKKIIVTGCLAERYKQEVLDEIPEIDAILGIGANGDIAKICKDALEGKQVATFPSNDKIVLNGQRLLTTPNYWAYLKISDGCSNCCTYCAIPKIRGKFKSREIEDILEEAEALAKSGVKEIVLVAQDTTRYGKDIYGKLMLTTLLNKLCKINSIEWIRLLYCYPDGITDELIETIAKQEKVVNYIDLPLQHADEKILKAMNRTGSKKELADLILRLRDNIPDVAIRTTLITGFPGEGEEEFETLAEFVREIKFDRLGCFAYSAEDGTPAADFENQVDEQEKIHRGELIMQAQYDIFIDNNKKSIGKTYKVLTEGYDAYSDTYYGRCYKDAPEIDGKVYFTCDDVIDEGEFVNVEILGINEYDLLGKVV